MSTAITSAATHVVVFQDKSKKFLNEQAYRAIYNAILAGKDLFPAGNQIINLKAIKVLESVEDYYLQYPSERPQVNEHKDFTGLGYERIVKTAPQNGLEQLIIGLGKAIDKMSPPEGSPSRELMAKMLKRKREHEDEEKKGAITHQAG